MNIEIANRLVQLRKQNHLSQEELAAKLGLSRQAVSKWERAEASPDTDNLILLSRLYGISLDELLKTEDEIPTPEERQEAPEDARTQKKAGGSKVHVGWQGIHVRDGKDEVHISWRGIHVHEHEGSTVQADKDHLFINGKDYKKSPWYRVPFGTIVTVIFILLGCIYQIWHPAWLLFMTIPLYYSLVHAIQTRDAHHFAYPVLTTMVYLWLGFTQNLWHPGWLVFVTVPVYYAITAPFHKKKQKDPQCHVDWE